MDITVENLMKELAFLESFLRKTQKQHGNFIIAYNTDYGMKLKSVSAMANRLMSIRKEYQTQKEKEGDTNAEM